MLYPTSLLNTFLENQIVSSSEDTRMSFNGGHKIYFVAGAEYLVNKKYKILIALA